VIWLQALIYFCFAIFVIVLLGKVVKYATMPLNLRWELYPVPHEKKAEHGGSYYEEPEWWKKPREITLLGEIKEMLKEMLFIERVFKHKRSLWWLTYPFHLGIYLILVWFALIFIGAILELIGIPISASGSMISPVIYYLTLVVGVVAMILMFVFGIGLIVRRFSDPDMRKYSSFLDYFNLIFIIAVVGTGFAAWQSDPDFSLAREFMKDLIVLSPLPSASGATILHVTLLSLLFLYIACTKMTHFIGKYFTYHKILWDDEPNLRGSEIEKKVLNQLNYRVAWRGNHIKPEVTWAEEATKYVPKSQEE